MANNLSKTNIVNGNIIEAADITQLVDSLTATEAYNITISGSFAFSGSTTGSGWFENAVSASRSITASYADTALSASYSLVAGIADTATTASFAITASYAETALSASFAITASHALNAGTPFEISASTYSGSTSTVSTVRFIFGSDQTLSMAPPFEISPVIAELAPYSPADLGDKVFITVSPVNNYDEIWLASVSFPGITFESTSGGADFHYQITYRQ